jgi:hypothetical protein
MDDSELGWMQIGKDIGGEVAYDVSGMHVSLSTDGKVKLWLSTLLIGIMKAGIGLIK